MSDFPKAPSFTSCGSTPLANGADEINCLLRDSFKSSSTNESSFEEFCRTKPFERLRTIVAKSGTKAAAAEFISSQLKKAAGKGGVNHGLEAITQEAGEAARSFPISSCRMIRDNLADAARISSIRNDPASLTGLPAADRAKGIFDAARLSGHVTSCTYPDALKAVFGLRGDSVKVTAVSEAIEQLQHNPSLQPKELEAGTKALGAYMFINAERGNFRSTPSEWKKAARSIGRSVKDMEADTQKSMKKYVMDAYSVSEGAKKGAGRMGPHVFPPLNNNLLNTLPNSNMEYKGSVLFNEGMYLDGLNSSNIHYANLNFESVASAKLFMKGTICSNEDMPHMDVAINSISVSTFLTTEEKAELLTNAVDKLKRAALRSGFHETPDAIARTLGRAASSMPEDSQEKLKSGISEVFGYSRKDVAVTMKIDGSMLKELDLSLKDKAIRFFEEGANYARRG